MRKYKVNGLDTAYNTDNLNDLSLAAIYNLGIGSWLAPGNDNVVHCAAIHIPP